ncbi:hypothetical protein [Spirosoma pollinicola]|uniref:hypothetical protein n=1 Tax=Spirosoma pollinicola TaxID=2057025 RepID=UPI0012FD3A56
MSTARAAPSDRGIQYCSKSYIALLDASDVQISMTQTGDPLNDNPVAERVNEWPPVQYT